jgi:hypothetical protein
VKAYSDYPAAAAPTATAAAHPAPVVLPSSDVKYSSSSGEKLSSDVKPLSSSLGGKSSSDVK